MVSRGEVWLAALDPTVGSEIRKTRPCLIISPDRMNSGLRTVLAAPMTSRGRPAPFRVAVRFRGKDGLVLPDQIRTLARQRLLTRLGTLDPETLTKVLAVLTAMFEE